MDGIRTRWLHIVKFLLIFFFFFVISLPLPFSRLRPRRRSPWSSAAIRLLFFLLHPSSSLAKEGGASGCWHGCGHRCWAGGVGGLSRCRGGPERGHLRGSNKPPCCGCRAAKGRAFSPAWTLHLAWSRGHGSCLQHHLLLSFGKLLLPFILIPTSDCCSVWGFGPCVLRSASSPAPTSPSWSDYVDNNV